MDIKLFTNNEHLYDKLNELSFFGEARIKNNDDIRINLSRIINSLGNYNKYFHIEPQGNFIYIRKRIPIDMKIYKKH